VERVSRRPFDRKKGTKGGAHAIISFLSSASQSGRRAPLIQVRCPPKQVKEEAVNHRQTGLPVGFGHLHRSHWLTPPCSRPPDSCAA
jgi:hypothetical protein